ncbi:MAG: nucleotide exchange factor GrpE [Proteobacteria bacterium]|nr:nucleotide exchange factor GrpE [Pseudomonadota bacterium]
MNDGNDNKPHDDAIEPEAIEAHDDVAAAEGDPAERLEALEGENGRLKDQLLRALADTENLRRRAEREKEDTSKYAVATLARDVLSVADNLRRALDSLPVEQARDDAIRNLLTGIEATERELLAIFERRGIKRIDPVGQRFDPNFHQAMFEVPNSGQEPGTVVQVLQPGYVIHDRLLRPALVGVAKSDGAEAPVHVDTRA